MIRRIHVHPSSNQYITLFLFIQIQNLFIINNWTPPHELLVRAMGFQPEFRRSIHASDSLISSNSDVEI